MKELSLAKQIDRQRRAIIRRSNQIYRIKRQIAQMQDDVAMWEKDMLNMQLALEKLRGEK